MGYLFYDASIHSLNIIKENFKVGQQVTYMLNDTEFTETVLEAPSSVISSSGSEGTSSRLYYVGNLDLIGYQAEEEIDSTFEEEHLIALYIDEDNSDNDEALIFGGNLEELSSFSIYELIEEAKTKTIYVEDESTIEPKLKESYLPKTAMTEEEEYIISKSLNDLNARINEITEIELPEITKNAEDSNLWKQKNHSLISKDASDCGDFSFVTGNNARGGDSSVVIGSEASASSYGIAIGKNSISNEGVSVGNNSYCNSDGIAIGNSAKNERMYAISLGNNANTTNKWEIALGDYNHSTKGITHFSIAAPKFYGLSRDNILEVSNTGKLYIKGLGNYTGKYSSSAKSLQEIIEEDEYVTATALVDLNSKITNISNNLSWNII